jgi:hypothetical protein
MTNLFQNRLHGINKQDKANIRVGACTILWDLWNTHNNIILIDPNKLLFLQVIYLASHEIHIWSCFQLEELSQAMVSECNRLKALALKTGPSHAISTENGAKPCY